MTLGVSEGHLELHAVAARWVAAHAPLSAARAAMDADGAGLPPFWDRLAALGWVGLAVPTDHGGEGFGLAELAIVLEELGRSVAPGPFLPSALAAVVIARFAEEPARDRYLPLLARGETTGAVGFSCPALEGSNRPGGLEVTGSAAPVLGAGQARVLVLPASTPDGEVWCIIERDQVSVEELSSLDPTRSLATVGVSDVVVPPDRQIGPLTGEVRVVDIAASLLAAESVGLAAWCTETAASYAREREQFGRPIGQFQAVKHRCAEMLCKLELCRAAAWDASRGGDEKEEALAMAAAGALVPKAAFEVAKDCIQVHGGIGFTWEHDAHLFLRRATATLQLLGGPARWRRRVADLATQGVRRPTQVQLPDEAEPLRRQVRAFVEETKRLDKAEWTARIAESGYLVPHWPEPWGRDAGPLEQLVIEEEFARARLRRPHLAVGAWVLPTLIAHGTPEQQQRWIPPTLRFEITWCQLFSEPGAGSDLASLSTRAERTDGGWLLRGQKVWTTLAHQADLGLCLARTDPDLPKHEGITCFVVDMASQGVEVRPLREITGQEMFNEVFLDGVFVPDEAVVGPPGGGWEAARTTLANERVSMGSGSSFGPGLESLLQLVEGALGLASDPVVLDEVGDLIAEAQAIAMVGLRMTLRALGGYDAGAEASVRKLLGVEHEQRVQEVGLRLLGPEGAVAEGRGAQWIFGFLGNRALSIAGGTSEIQRNVIAERLLGLPKDP